MSTNHSDDKATHAIYWEALGKSDPDDVFQRTGALFDAERRGYTLSILQHRYLILPKERKILRREGESFEEEHFRDNFYLMVLLYLLNSKGGQPGGNWISEKELRGGTTFFRGPHALPVEEIKRAFGNNPERFIHAGSRLGGVELIFGDKAFSLTVFPKVPVAYVLWQEDLEFPARVSVLFDTTIQNHFSLDGIWCLVAETSQLLVDARE